MTNDFTKLFQQLMEQGQEMAKSVNPDLASFKMPDMEDFWKHFGGSTYAIGEPPNLNPTYDALVVDGPWGQSSVLPQIHPDKWTKEDHARFGPWIDSMVLYHNGGGDEIVMKRDQEIRWWSHEIDYRTTPPAFGDGAALASSFDEFVEMYLKHLQATPESRPIMPFGNE